MWTSKFWTETGERALKTFAQAAAAALAGDRLGVLSVDWLQALSIAALAAVLSVLTSISSAPVGDENSPSLVN